MSLVKINTDGPPTRGGCTLGQWSLSLPPEESAALQKMLTEKRTQRSFLWSAAAVAEEINNDPDYTVRLSHQMVSRHRSRSCSCDQ